MNIERIDWAEVAEFVALYEAMIQLRPPSRDEQLAYNRACGLINRNSLPIPRALKM